MKRAFILLLILLCFVPCVCSAQTVSFASPDTTSQKDVYLYAANGTLLGLYNTSSTGIAIPNGTDIIFTFKPQYTNPLDDPGTWLDSGYSYVETNIVPLIVIIFLIGLLLRSR